jgi:hypothetical protein
MSDFENPISPSSTTASDAQTTKEIRAAIESLRGVFQVVALSGIVLSATLLAFLYKEISVVRRQNNELIGYLNEFQTSIGSKIDSARTNLPTFAKTNASIEPIMKKYFATNAPATTPPPPPPPNP